MLNKMLKLAGATTIFVTVLALSAGPAFAKMTCTVTNGGTNLPATQKGNATFFDTSTQKTVTCTAGTEGVAARNGSGLSSDNIAQISNTKLTNCSGPFTGGQITQVGTASVNVFSFARLTGTVTGTLTNLDLNISGSGCTAELVGTTNVSYSNLNGTFTLSPDVSLLTVKSANCGNALHSGNVIDYNTQFVMDHTPLLQITSP